jgi:hypothetical protein
MVNAGFSAPFAEFTSGTNLHLVYEWVNNPNKIYGRLYLEIIVSNTFTIRQQLYTGWSGTAGQNGTSNNTASGAFLNTVQLSLNSFNGENEFKLVVLRDASSTSYAILGILAPQNRRQSWDLDNYPYGWCFVGATATALRSTNIEPFGNTNADFTGQLGNARMSGQSNDTGTADIIKRLILFSQANTGVSAWTSLDLGYGCFSGLARYSTININGEIWCAVNPVAGGLAVRIG